MSHYNMVKLGTLIQPAKTVRCGSNDYPVLSMTMHDGLVFQDDRFRKTVASKDRSDYKVVKHFFHVGTPILSVYQHPASIMIDSV